MHTEEAPEEPVEESKLASHFTAYVNAYRRQKEKELSKGKRTLLEEECKRLEVYVNGCLTQSIPDSITNINFCAAKAESLRKLLGLPCIFEVDDLCFVLPKRKK